MRFFCQKILVGFIALIVSLQGVHGQSIDQAADSLASEVRENRSLPGGLPVQKDHACAFHGMNCGQTVRANLTANDCLLGTGSFAAFVLFTGQAGQTVTIDLSSSAFDPFLALLDPDSEVVASDTDGGPGNSSRIVYRLNRTSSAWSIGVTTLQTLATGPYTLRLLCSGSQPPPPPPPPPSDGFFSDPNYPDFRFRVSIGDTGSTIPGSREDVCLPDTICVSGQLPGRSELFIRILGPRPNGFLWPTLVRFTPSRVLVEIRQISTNRLNVYLLDAVPPGTEELDGLQDREGFLP